MTWTRKLELRGPAGEPVDLRRTIHAHGLTSLPPLRTDADHRGFRGVVTVPGGRPLHVVVREAPGGHAAVVSSPGAPAVTVSSPVDVGSGVQDAALAAVAHLLRLDEDLSPFYALVAEDPDLAWCTSGAGRLMRSQTVFEDVIKTICTTNCAWSATVRMVTALVDHLGDEARGGGRAFPAAAALAAAPETFYADVARAGYRGPFLRTVAAAVADGSLDLDGLAALPDDDELEAGLLELAGVGPYAAAHIMLMLGRHSRLVLDSWTRPTYRRLSGAKGPIKDTTIQRRFRRHGDYAGLAFWLTVTEDWIQRDA